MPAIKRENARVRSISIKTGIESPPAGEERGRGRALLLFDSIARNMAVVGALILLVAALGASEGGGARDVLAAVKAGASMEWDESLGKLSFVSSLMPVSARSVWSETEGISLCAPIAGETVHAWSRSEPYMELSSLVRDVRAVSGGEVMSIAHGLSEELIIRVRHDGGLESLYGNLESCFVEQGAYVYEGDIIARLRDGLPLAFELRRDGRSVDPTDFLREAAD